MHKPKVLKINGIDYEVKYDLQASDNMWGMIDDFSRVIRLYPAEQDIDLLATIIHESLHAISGNLHLSLEATEADHNKLDVIALSLADMLLNSGIIENEIRD